MQSQESKSKKKDERVRNYCTVFYPESCPGNWKEIIGELAIPCVVSPLHDKDMDPTGIPKKAHYHALFLFDGKKSVDQFLEIITPFGGVGYQKVESVRGMARYLCHLDNPDKVQYNPEDCCSFGGVNYYELINLVDDKYRAIREMIDFCDRNDVTEFCYLISVARYDHPDWFRVLCDNGSFVMREYLKSKRHSINGDNYE